MLGTPAIIDRKPTKAQRFGDNPPEKVFVQASELHACPVCNAEKHCWTLYNGRVVGCYNRPYWHSLGRWGKVGKNKKSGRRFWKYTVPVAEAVPPPPDDPDPPPVYDVVRRYQLALTRERGLDYLKAINVPSFMESYVAEIGLGWRPEVKRRHAADKPAIWVQPEYNADGDPIGYCGRTEYGDKDGDLGTKRGAFYLVGRWNDPKHLIRRTLAGPEVPEGFRGVSRAYSLSAEGHSCSAALAAMGILSFVSRFSVNGAIKIMARMFRRPENRHITPVLIGENDKHDDKAHWPGWAMLHPAAEKLATLIGRPVVIAMCPDGLKDVRVWAHAFAGVQNEPAAGTKWTTRDHTPESWAQLGRTFLDRLFAAGNLEFVHPGPAPAPAVHQENACPNAYHAQMRGKPGTTRAGDYAAIDSVCGQMDCPACSVAKANSHAVWNHLCITQVAKPAHYPHDQTAFHRDPIDADQLNVSGKSYGPWRSYYAVVDAAECRRILDNLRNKQSLAKRHVFQYLRIPVADTVFDSQNRWIVGALPEQSPISLQDLQASQIVDYSGSNPPALAFRNARYILAVVICPTQAPAPGLTRTDPVRLLATVQAASREWADAYFLACPKLPPAQDTAENRKARDRLTKLLPRQTSSKEWELPDRHVSSGNFERACSSVLPAADMRAVADAANLLDRKGVVAGTQDSAVWSDRVSGAGVVHPDPFDLNPDADTPPEALPRPATCSPAALLFEIGKAVNWKGSGKRPDRDDLIARLTTLRRAIDGLAVGPAVLAEVRRLIPMTPDVCLDRVRLENAAADDARTAESRRLQREALREYENAVIDVPEGFLGGAFDPPKAATTAAPPKPRKPRKPRRKLGYGFPHAMPPNVRGFMELHSKYVK